MADPSYTIRSAPVGIIVEDGQTALVAFERDPDLSIWETSSQPPGIDNGEEINITSHHNQSWRTFAPRVLKTLTPFTIGFMYDPAAVQQIRDLCGKRGSISFYWPDGSKMAFYGYLKNATFDPLVDGEPAKGQMVIVPTNYDPVNRVEAGPVMSLVAGT